MSKLIYNMPLFHGGMDHVKYPSVTASRINCDFGPGFYCTTNVEQAKQWAYAKILQDPRRPTYAVSEYRFKPDELITVKDFGAEPSAAWFQAIIDGRNGFNLAADIVVGPVADSNIRELVAEAEKALAENMHTFPYSKQKEEKHRILEYYAKQAVPPKYQHYDQVVFLTCNGIEKLDFVNARLYDRNHKFVFLIDKDENRKPVTQSRKPTKSRGRER